MGRKPETNLLALVIGARSTKPTDMRTKPATVVALDPADQTIMVAICCYHVTATPPGLQVVLMHQVPELLVVHRHALVTQRRRNPTAAIVLELVTDRADLTRQSSTSSGACAVS